MVRLNNTESHFFIDVCGMFQDMVIPRWFFMHLATDSGEQERSLQDGCGVIPINHWHCEETQPGTRGSMMRPGAK